MSAERAPQLDVPDVRGCDFHPVIRLPAGYEVYDFTRGYDPARTLARGWTITRDEQGRPVRSIGDAPAGTRLVTTVVDGIVKSRVDE